MQMRYDKMDDEEEKGSYYLSCSRLLTDTQNWSGCHYHNGTWYRVHK